MATPPLLLAAATCERTVGGTASNEVYCPHLSPDLKGWDGTLHALSGALLWLALVLALVSVLVGAVLLIYPSNNPAQKFSGKKAIIAGLSTALFIGLLPALLTFWINVGEKSN